MFRLIFFRFIHFLREKGRDNVPMQYVPKGYKAYLFNRYEEYREYYYNDKDHWSEVVKYEDVIYAIKRMIEEDGCHQLSLFLFKYF